MAVLGEVTFALVGSIASVAGMLLVFGWAVVRTVVSELKLGLGLILGMLAPWMIVIGIAFALVAFVLGPLTGSAVSHRREFLADTSGVELTRFPEGLVRALEKIHAHPMTVQAASFEARGLFFVNTIGEGVLAQWLGSHPPVAERAERLKQIGRGFYGSDTETFMRGAVVQDIRITKAALPAWPRLARTPNEHDNTISC